MEHETDLSRLIGRRIADRRDILGLSLEEMAARSGVSRAMISRIERGEVHASAVLLDKLCTGLGLALSALFARETPSPLLRRNDQPVWQDPENGCLRRDVTPTGTGSPVRIVAVELPPGAEAAFDASREQALEQHVWVLKGEIEISIGATGEKPGAGVTHHLAKGDCLYMRLAAGSFRNVSGKPARYAIILTLDAPACDGLPRSPGINHSQPACRPE